MQRKKEKKSVWQKMPMSWNKNFELKGKGHKPSQAENPSARAMAWASLARIITTGQVS